MHSLPAFAVQAVDTTGAGDAFHGAFAFALGAGWPVRRALRFSAAVAALKCQRPGGRAGLPDLASALALVDSIKE
ncbi:carbohydrate kinase [Verminephrobacter eiseniae]|nr:carbohydrate kinase [Verminephrobacter eiseniae]